MAIKFNIKAVGGDMVLDDSPVSKKLKRQGIYEPNETALFKKQLKPSDVFLDIGAHIGYYSLMASKIIKTGKVHAFEPSVDSQELLLENLMLNDNGLGNTVAYAYAASDRTGNDKFYIDTVNRGNNALYDQSELYKNKDVCEAITVETKILDELFKDEKVDFIKMDTQGAEFNALMGLKWTIKHNKIKMIIEYYPYGLKRMGHEPILFFKLLAKMGFDVYKIGFDRLVQITNFKRFVGGFGKSHTNLYCVKGEVK